MAFNVLTRMFVWSDGITQVFSWTVVSIVLVVICHTIAGIRAKKNSLTKVNGFYAMFDLNTVTGLVIFFLAIILTVMFAYTNSSPFIYFQF